MDDALGKLLAAAQFFPRQLEDTARLVEEQNAELMLKFQEDQAAEQDDFWSQVKDLETTVSELGGFTDMEECAVNAARVEEMMAELKELQARADLYNSREGMFGVKQTDYGAVKKIAEQFDPFYQFWTYAQGWRDGLARWRDGAFVELDAEGMDRDVTAAFKVMFKMGKAFNQRNCPTAPRTATRSGRRSRPSGYTCRWRWPCGRPACARGTGRRSRWKSVWRFRRRIRSLPLARRSRWA